MQLHANCVARDGDAVLLLGPPGSGKSDLTLQLIDRGFMLVADDRVDIEAGFASPPAALAGLLEVRGLGIVRLAYRAPARLRLAVDLARAPERLPATAHHPQTGLPLIAIDPRAHSAAQRVVLALDCVLGRAVVVQGALAP